MFKKLYLLMLALLLLQPGLSVVVSIVLLVLLIAFKGSTVNTPADSSQKTKSDLLILGLGLLYPAYFFGNTLIQSQNLNISIHWLLENLPVCIVLLISFWLKKKQVLITSRDIALTAAFTLHLTLMLIVCVALMGHFTQSASTMAWITEMGLTPGGRAELWLHNPLMLASVSLGFAFLSLLDIENIESTKESFFYQAAFIEGLVIAFYFAESRGSIVTFLMLFVVFVWVFQIKLRRFVKPLLALTVILLVAYAWLPEAQTKINNLVVRLMAIPQSLTTSGIPTDSSIHQRFLMYQHSLQAIWEQPIWGYGVDMRFAAIEPHMNPNEPYKYPHVHNTYLDHWVSGGLVGLALFLMHVGSPLLKLKSDTQLAKSFQFVLVLGPLMVLGIGLTNDTHWHYIQAQFFSLLIGLSILLSSDKHSTVR